MQDHSIDQEHEDHNSIFIANIYNHALFLSCLLLKLNSGSSLLCLAPADKWVPWDHQYLLAQCMRFLGGSDVSSCYSCHPNEADEHTIHLQ